VEQVITKDGKDLLNVTSNEVKLSATASPPVLGWSMELSAVDPKQRVIFPAVMVSPTYAVINTMAPAASVATCEASFGTSAYFLLPVMSGAQHQGPVWDTDGNGSVGTGDSNDAGYTTGYGGKTTIIQMPVPREPGSPPKPPLCDNLNPNGDKTCAPPPDGHGKIRSRVWQQLMTPPF